MDPARAGRRARWRICGKMKGLGALAESVNLSRTSRGRAREMSVGAGAFVEGQGSCQRIDLSEGSRVCIRPARCIEA